MKIHLAVEAYRMLVKFKIISGTVADCQQPLELIESIEMEAILADKIMTRIKFLRLQNLLIWNVIPLRKNRENQRKLDHEHDKLIIR